jgi:hypothetical protein
VDDTTAASEQGLADDLVFLVGREDPFGHHREQEVRHVAREQLAGVERCVGPSTVTPPIRTSWSGTVTAQLPPREAATSTITDPNPIARTASSVSSTGARRPGIAAVQITTSTLATTCTRNSC